MKNMLFLMLMIFPTFLSAQADGNVGIGASPNQNYKLNVSKNGTSGSNSLRAIYSDGTAEVNGDFVIGKDVGKYVFTTSFTLGQDYLSIAPNTSGSSTNYHFDRELRLWENGELVKYVDDASQRAITVDFNGARNFQVMGDGAVYAREIEVKLSSFPDYVFEPEYELMTLPELGNYININKHLPNIPSAIEIEESGIGLGELSRLQMEKIEELTLYILELSEKIEELETQMKGKE